MPLAAHESPISAFVAKFLQYRHDGGVELSVSHDGMSTCNGSFGSTVSLK